MDLYETLLIGAAALIFVLLLAIVFYIMCHYTKQKGDYVTEEAKRATDFGENSAMGIQYHPDGLQIPQRREWFI